MTSTATKQHSGDVSPFFVTEMQYISAVFGLVGAIDYASYQEATCMGQEILLQNRSCNLHAQLDQNGKHRLLTRNLAIMCIEHKCLILARNLQWNTLLRIV